MQRHHKRTPYSSNAFPVESYHWNCDDSALYYYAQPFEGHQAAKVYQSLYISDINPFVQSGWIGTCRFPQITAQGLDDCWQHGSDLYGVYGELLRFLPRRGASDFGEKVKYRVTNNVITSQVAGMVIDGMWKSEASLPLMVQVCFTDKEREIANLYRLRAWIALNRSIHVLRRMGYSTISSPVPIRRGSSISIGLRSCIALWTISQAFQPTTTASTCHLIITMITCLRDSVMPSRYPAS